MRTYADKPLVAARYRKHKQSIPRDVKERKFPPPIYFGKNSPRWLFDDLDRYDELVRQTGDRQEAVQLLLEEKTAVQQRGQSSQGGRP
jgi:hypothetical protein